MPTDGDPAGTAPKRRRDPLGGGGQEAAVAARRVEDAQAVGGGAGGEHGIEHVVEDVVDERRAGCTRRPGACARRGHGGGRDAATEPSVAADPADAC